MYNVEKHQKPRVDYFLSDHCALFYLLYSNGAICTRSMLHLASMMDAATTGEILELVNCRHFNFLKLCDVSRGMTLVYAVWRGPGRNDKISPIRNPQRRKDKTK
jgi:hypothetical protein